MTTRVHTESPTVALKADPVVTVEESEIHNEPNVLVLFEEGQDRIVEEIASVLGQQWTCLQSADSASSTLGRTVIGVSQVKNATDVQRWKGSRTILSTHCLDDSNSQVGARSSFSDFEYLYTTKPFYRRDLARFLSLSLIHI